MMKVMSIHGCLFLLYWGRLDKKLEHIRRRNGLGSGLENSGIKCVSLRPFETCFHYKCLGHTWQILEI